MKKIIYSCALLLTAIAVTSFTPGDKWDPVFEKDITIGNSAVQDFSKENLIFQMNCNGTGDDKYISVKFFRPEKLSLKPADRYVLETEIHYDDSHYLIIKKIDDPSSKLCMYNCQIYVRKENK